MPFSSQTQWKWAFATGQPFARRWARETPGGKRKFRRLQRFVQKYKMLIGNTELFDAIMQQYRGDRVKELTTYAHDELNWARALNRYEYQHGWFHAEKADDATGSGTPRKYGARSGEVIAGNLGRDSSGKFARVGAALSQTNYISGSRAAKPTKQPAKRGRSSSAQSPADDKKNRAKLGAESMERIGYGKDGYATLNNVLENPPTADLAKTDATVGKMVSDGLLEEVNGKLYSTKLGKEVVGAVESGKPAQAQEALDRKVARETEQAKLEADREEAKLEAEAVAAEEEKKKPKGGGGGGGKAKPDPKKEQQVQEYTQQIGNVDNAINQLRVDIKKPPITGNPNDKVRLRKEAAQRVKLLGQLSKLRKDLAADMKKNTGEEYKPTQAK